MPAAPHPAGRQPRRGSRLPSQVIADNVKLLREEEGYSQARLAALMSTQGQRWGQSTVSQVELGTRHVNVDELFALAGALGVRLPDLLSPLTTRNFVREAEVDVDLGTHRPMPGQLFDQWVRDRAGWIVLKIDKGRATLYNMEIVADDHPPEESEP